MPVIIDYIAKLSICLGVVYGFYFLLLRKLTFYNWNRWYLLGYTILAFIIPVINVMPELQKKQLHQNAVLQWIPVVGYTTNTVGEDNFLTYLTHWEWMLVVLCLGSVALVVRLSIKYYSFKKMKAKGRLISTAQTKIYQIDDAIAPFSFGNAIFINQALHSEDELKEIIRHEFVHVKQQHTIDIICCELLCIINWYNPFAWLLRHSIRQNLEFIADHKVIQQGFDKKEYQYLLLKVMGNRQFAFTPHFNFSSLKKRIIMMNTIKSAKVHAIKFLFLLPVVAVLLLSFRKEIEKKLNIQAAVNTETTLAAQPIPLLQSTDTLPTKEATLLVLQTNKKYNDSSLTNRHTGLPNSSALHTANGKAAQPLIVLDGKPLAEGTDLNDIVKPADIESIMVLKDNAAKALYGSKGGANGVIEITTKKEVAAKKQSVVTTDSLQAQVRSIGITLKHPNANEVSQPVNKKSITNIGLIIPPPHTQHTNKKEGTALSAQNPLFVVDNIIVSKETVSTIDPATIESVNIYKEKAATSLYGEKAKQGVVVITSKNKAPATSQKPATSADKKIILNKTGLAGTVTKKDNTSLQDKKGQPL